MTDSETNLNQAREWHRQGDIARAKAAYEAILQAEPDNAQARHLLGVAALQTGDPRQAITMISGAIEIDGGDPQFHNNLGEALRALGRHDEALASYRQARVLKADFAIAINNEGATCLALGRGADAIQCFRDAMAADAAFLPAQVNLGLALLGAGDGGGALAALTAPLAVQANNTELQRYFSLAAVQAPAEAFDDNAAARVEALFQNSGIELQRLLRPALLLLEQRGLLERLALATDEDIQGGDHDGDLNDNLLHAVLIRTVVANAPAENFMTRLRRLCILSQESGLVGRVPKFAAALAQQCFITDYAYAETPDETQAVDTMAARAEAMLQQGTLGQKLESALTAIAMYRPLNTLAGIEKAVVSTELAPLLYQQSGGPAEEAALAASVAVLSEEVSEPAVRQQYEDAPYPRWLTTDRKMPVPMAAAVGALFPKLDYTPGAATPRILVAGCGTGKQAMDAATQYKDAQVTAIDISRASLGYARRMAAADGVDNIAFMAADIMALGAWEARFDLVESSGVLHHLQDPEAGWRNLCGLLAPGGLMKVALYSTLGRRDLQAARDFVARDDGNGDGNGGGKGGGAVTPERIRQARADILALAEDDPRRRATRYSDYFSLRGCRDLLFNVREQDYSLLELASMMRRLHLDFIGFQFADINLPARLAAAHPGARLDDLALWHEFETANPEIFSGMYQFWCRPSLAN